MVSKQNTGTRRTVEEPKRLLGVLKDYNPMRLATMGLHGSMGPTIHAPIFSRCDDFANKHAMQKKLILKLPTHCSQTSKERLFICEALLAQGVGYNLLSIGI